MSGPYPPSGYPQQPGNWPGNQPGAPGPGSGGQQQPGYDFPTVPYGGLSGAGGNPGWSGQQPTQPIGQPFPQPGYGDQGQQPQPGQQFGQPYGQPGHPGGQPGQPYGQPGGQPPKRRRAGGIVVAVLSVLVIIGGAVTAFVVLHNRQQTPAQAAAPATTSATTPTPTSAQTTTAPAATTQVAEGTTTLTLAAGQCVTATVATDSYAISKQATCGAADSDFVLAKSAAQVSGCEARQYLAIQATTGVYCFTLDLKQGDCLDNNYLKTPCGAAPFMVLTTEPGPGTSNSCANSVGASHWVPMGVNPVKVACIGPPKA